MPLIAAFALTFSMPTTASEQEQLAQAIKQLDAAQASLVRALQQSKTSAKSREYFDYSAAQRDISTVKNGIQQYISPSRAIPRNPQALRTLREDYTKLRGQ
ncbi:RAQPRD family integrative conjugative element protein [Pasteurella testudinis]|nr:RAQPRD family integrative conjugative element protein [Pasteurella testudinis]